VPFSRIISRDNGTPWPATGMTSLKWLAVHTRDVYIADLVATQPGVLFHALVEDPRVPVGADPYPHVVEWRGVMYLEDGHHRAMRALLRGERAIRVRYLKVS
jgi:hypothetical protein